MNDEQTQLGASKANGSLLKAFALGIYLFFTHWITLTVLVVGAVVCFGFVELIENAFGGYIPTGAYISYLSLWSLLFLPMILLRIQQIKLFIYLGFLGGMFVIYLSPWSSIPEFGRRVEAIQVGMSIDQVKSIIEDKGMLWLNKDEPPYSEYTIMRTRHTVTEYDRNASSIGHLSCKNDIVTECRFVALD